MACKNAATTAAIATATATATTTTRSKRTHAKHSSVQLRWQRERQQHKINNKKQKRKKTRKTATNQITTIINNLLHLHELMRAPRMSAHSVTHSGCVYARVLAYHCIAFKCLYLFVLIFSALNSINHSKLLIDRWYKCLLRKRSLAYGDPQQCSVSNKLYFTRLQAKRKLQY